MKKSTHKTQSVKQGARKLPPTARKVTPSELRQGIIAFRKHWTGSLIPVYAKDANTAAAKKHRAWKTASPVKRHKKLVELNALYHDTNEYRDKLLSFETQEASLERRHKWSVAARVKVPLMQSRESMPADWKASKVKLRVTKDGVRFI